MICNIHEITLLPERRMCETLQEIDLDTLRKFYSHYGHTEGPDIPSPISFEAHLICCTRLFPDPPKPKKKLDLLPGPKKAAALAERADVGLHIAHERDISYDDLGDGVAREVNWKRQDVLRMEGLRVSGPVSAGQAKILKRVQRAEAA